MATYNGTSGNDTYSGGGSSDNIRGNGGNDTLYGNGGRDTVFGGSGNDIIDGGSGSDRLDGGSGSDTVKGGTNNDKLVYRLYENGGATDIYSGDGGIDTLSLMFTSAQWQSAIVQSEVARYVQYLATVPRSSNGEVLSGTDFTFDFGSSTTLKVSTIEKLEVLVDGALVNLSVPRITSAQDSGAVAEDATLSASGAIDFSDSNLTDTHTVAVLAVTGYTNPVGGTMSAMITDAATGDGVGRVTWAYQVTNAATQYLAAGETAVEKFNIRITDSTGSSVTQLVNITVTGTNDGVSITSGPPSGAVAEDVTPGASGAIAFTDVDLSDTHTASFAPTPSNTTALGTFAVTVSEATNAETGSVAWSYSLDNGAAQYLAAGESASETYIVTVGDGHGATASQSVVITVTGTNDAPIVSAQDAQGAVTEPATPAGDLTDSGTLGFTDADLSDTHLVSAAGTPIGSTLGTLVAALDSDTGNGTGGRLTWRYTVAAADVDYLSAGQQRIESFTITVDDRQGGQTSRQIDITVTGTNDPVSITSGAQAGAVVEDVTPSAAGVVSFTDVDLGDTHTASVAAAPGNTTALGTLAATVSEAPNAAAGSVAWLYTLSSSAAQYLAAGESVVETYVVTVNDGHGATATQDVVITITGTADTNPTAYASQIATNADRAILGKLSASPAQAGDTLTFSVGTAPVHGVLELQADGDYRYTPAAGYTGGDAFTFLVTDNHGATATAEAAIAIAATGTGQVAYIDLASLQVDEQVSPPIARSWQAPEAAALAGGGHVVVWSAYDQSGYGLFQARFGADGQRIGAPQRVNTAPGGDQLHASVAAAGNGWVVTWSSGDGSGWGVFARRYDADGAALGGPEQVNPAILGDQAEASVAELAGGGYVISWTGYGGGNGTTDVYARIYAAAGAAITNAFVVNSTTAGSQNTEGRVTENVAGISGGRFVVVWSDEAGSGPGVYGRVFEANGTAVAGEFTVGTTGTGQYASVAAVGGGFVVTWSAYGTDGSGTAVYARRFDADGNALDNPFQVNRWPLGDQLYAKVQALADGGFVVVWQSYGAAGSDNADICGRRYDANGIATGDEFLIGGKLGDDQFPSLALVDGALVVTWLDGSLGTIEQKIIADFATDTTPLGDFRIDDQVSPPTVNGGGAPEAAALGGGGHIVVWTGYGTDDASGLGVYQQRHDAAGAKIGAPQLVNVATGGDQTHASVAAIGGGGWVVTWTAWTGTGWGLYARWYGANGQAGGGETLIGTTLGEGVAANAGELASGGCVISWSGYNGDSGTLDVYARRYDANGNAAANAFVVNSATAGSQVSEGALTENAAGLTGGRFVVVWSGDGASGQGVYGRVFEADDTAVAEQFAVGTATGTEQDASVGAVGGGFVVAWHADDGSGKGVYARRYAADGTPLGDGFQVNGRVAGDQAHAKVQELGDGGFVVVWQYGAAGSNGAEIWGRRYDAAGNAVGGEFRIGSDLGDNLTPALALAGGSLVAVWADGTFGTIEQKIVDDFLTDTTAIGGPSGNQVSAPVVDGAQPEVAALADGGHVVVWSGYASDDTSGAGVYQQRHDAAGAKIGAPQRVNVTTAGDQAYAGVAANGSGWVVTWSSYNPSTETWSIYAQRYGADGSPIGGETPVNQSSLPWWGSGPGVGELANGGYVITWDGLNAGTVDVYARLYDANGSAGNPFIVNSVTAGDQTTEGASSAAENVIGLADGRFVVVWHGNDGFDHVYGRVFAANGKAVAGQFEIGTTVNNYAASVGAVGAGFVASWTSWEQDVADVYAQRYDGDGVALGGAFRVNSWGMGEQAFSKVQALADGGFVIAWQSYGVDGSDRNFAVSGQRYDAAGNAVGGEFIVGAADAAGEADTLPSLALRQDGALVVVWQDGSAGSIEQKIVTRFEPGGAAAKNLLGGDGSDSFIGSDLADTLAGAGGDDRLDGLLGSDRLAGGNGADAFVFGTAPGAGNVDTIDDFRSGVDTVRLSNAAGSPFAGLPAGPLAAAVFDIVGDATAPTAATRIIYNPDSGALYFDADGAGGAAAAQFAVVLLGAQPAALVLGDFIVGA